MGHVPCSALVVVMIALSALGCVHGNRTTINLSVYLPVTGRRSVGNTIGPAARLAVDDINNSDELLPNHHLQISTYDTKCEEGKALIDMVHTLVESKKKVDGIIGGGCDVVCVPFGLLASEFEIPMVSWGCTDLTLSNKQRYSTFSRTIGTAIHAFHATMGLLRYFNWKRVSILASVSGTWQWLAEQLSGTTRGK